MTVLAFFHKYKLTSCDFFFSKEFYMDGIFGKYELKQLCSKPEYTDAF